jgi:hypothetical protein
VLMQVWHRALSCKAWHEICEWISMDTGIMPLWHCRILQGRITYGDLQLPILGYHSASLRIHSHKSDA